MASRCIQVPIALTTPSRLPCIIDGAHRGSTTTAHEEMRKARVDATGVWDRTFLQESEEHFFLRQSAIVLPLECAPLRLAAVTWFLSTIRTNTCPSKCGLKGRSSPRCRISFLVSRYLSPLMTYFHNCFCLCSYLTSPDLLHGYLVSEPPHFISQNVVWTSILTLSMQQELDWEVQ